MRFISETTADGVSERQFVLNDIPGLLWSPADEAGGRPLVLLAHGGGHHKKAPGVLARAHRYVTGCGFAAAAIDAPGHGDRPRTEREDRLQADAGELVAAGKPLGPLFDRYNAELAALAIPEWRATLDALPDHGPVGFWGMSMGSGIGVHVAAAEPRITAAVFGLAGGEFVTEAAARVTIPVEFWMQWDDEAVPRESSFALFDAFASREKAMVANPGRHMELPRSEPESSQRFFARHLSK